MWDKYLSIATIFLSLIAIVINIYQNRVTKKQNLFDRRLRLYLEFLDIWNLYKNNIFFLDNLDPRSIDVEFSYITNSANLYVLADIMPEPLDNAKKVKFLTACENMKKDAKEFRFVYDKKYIKCANFIEAYVNMIQQFHRQQIFIKSLDKQSKEKIESGFNPFEHDYVEQECKKFAQNENGLVSSIQDIKKIYEAIEKDKLLEKLERAIKF